MRLIREVIKRYFDPIWMLQFWLILWAVVIAALALEAFLDWI